MFRILDKFLKYMLQVIEESRLEAHFLDASLTVSPRHVTGTIHQFVYTTVHYSEVNCALSDSSDRGKCGN